MVSAGRGVLSERNGRSKILQGNTVSEIPTLLGVAFGDVGLWLCCGRQAPFCRCPADHTASPRQGGGPPTGAERALPAHVPAGARHRQKLRARQDPQYVVAGRREPGSPCAAAAHSGQQGPPVRPGGLRQPPAPGDVRRSGCCGRGPQGPADGAALSPGAAGSSVTGSRTEQLLPPGAVTEAVLSSIDAGSSCSHGELLLSP